MKRKNNDSSNMLVKKQYLYCLRCGRKLKTDEARERGFGKICWEKFLSDPQQSLF